MGSFVELLPCFLKLGPVLACLLQVFDSVLKLPLFSHELLNFVQRILASEFFQDVEALSKVFVFLLELKHFSVLVVNLFGLLLDGGSKLEVSLKYFLHHVESVHYSLSDGILRLVGSAMGL